MKKLHLLIILCISLLYISIRVLYFINIPTSTEFDTGSYVRSAELRFFSKDFWTGIRPVTYPLMIKAMNFNLDSLVIAQFVLSIAAWLLFAYSFSRLQLLLLVRFFSYFFILIFSFSTDVILWDRIAQTESVNISLLIIILSFIFINIKNQKKIPLIIILGLVFFWVFLRDTNAWFVFFFGLLLFVYLVLRKSDKSKFIILSFLVLFFILSNLSASVGRRWVVPFLNVMSSRILPSTDLLYEFELRGIPVTDTLLDQKYKNFSNEYFTNSNLEDFRIWLFNDGKRAYLSFLVRNPSYFLQAPFENWSFMFGYLPNRQNTTNDNLDYAPINFREILPYPISEIVYPKKFGLMAIFLGLILSGYLLSTISSQEKISGLHIGLAIIICSYPMFILIFHGDASGISRHAVAAILPLVLSCWLVVIQLIDKFCLNEYAHHIK